MTDRKRGLTKRGIITLICAMTSLLYASPAVPGGRVTLSLDGQWQIAEGKLNERPVKYDHTVSVPGLADMAVPPFENPGSTVSLENRHRDSLHSQCTDPLREAFWYRRTFRVDGPLPAVALLKINKARYGAKVFINGQEAGEHAPNFTPGWFDVRPYLKADGAENEVIVRIGASLAQVQPGVPEGWDYEKSRYIPGIYDSVSLILSGTPHIANVQTVPMVPEKSVRVVAELSNAGRKAVQAGAKCVVREVKSGKEVGKGTTPSVTIGPGQTVRAEVTLAIDAAHLWTPEDPFLYQLEVDTGADHYVTRFGLRSFTFDPETGRALLNGKTYFMRGSSVCIYRFFEDAERGALPWDETWVRNLHRKFKDMHWNSLRYCIGFPPERWYEIADEEGILIQDEFPIWYNKGWPKAITADELKAEFTEWMRERWNHPCVVIWDAQNETKDADVTSATIGMVRGLDLSDRPWDNGWGEAQKPTDPCEAHPYRSSWPNFDFAMFTRDTGIPNTPSKGSRMPYVINEYGWLWINRDGSLPTLSPAVYDRDLGPGATVQERWHYYARTLAAKTEFWRGRRKCAGVLEFCALGYSRPDGQTCDHFVDVKNLVYEPEFYRYVRDAFAPVGLMLDYWDTEVVPGTQVLLRVQGLNDLDKKWSGTVRLRLLQGDKTLWENTKPLIIPAWDVAVALFDADLPKEFGTYTLEAALIREGDDPVCSLRDVKVIDPSSNFALNRPVTASSEVRNKLGFFPAALAVDGRKDTRWSSEFSDPQWLAVDLGESKTFSRIDIVWDKAFAKKFAIEVSDDGTSWKQVYSSDKGRGGRQTIRFSPVSARWVRLVGTERNTEYGYSIWEFRVTEK